MFSARLYGSRGHRAERLLKTEGKAVEDEESEVIIRKSMKPEDFTDEAVRELLASMEETQLRAPLSQPIPPCGRRGSRS